MSITYVQPQDYIHLENIACLISTASRVVVVTGAGISTKAGIPDYRSKNSNNSRYRRSLFHSSVFSDPEKKSCFYKEVTRMHKMAKDANPTETHHFINDLHRAGKLVRCYTQNIDCLEDKVGLCTDLQKGPGIHFKHQANGQSSSLCVSGGMEYVLLHGSVHCLRCSFCSKVYSWDDSNYEKGILAGKEPFCPGCAKLSADRVEKGKRPTAIRTLRPDIVLYGEENPQAEYINEVVKQDLHQRPDILLIMGTSLTTYGVKYLIRDFAEAPHEQNGKVVYVNRTRPAKEWDNIIDYWAEQECDIWVQDLKRRQSALL
ncbi:Putative Sirtuin family, DHS-like NAD/FAD-binding domain superfamily [Colletotrichum destructivum]|uniref:Sirtuin family, DHS-like NAD/FAD-binding domain superfamily n=1 Tax=Colletotrichum destructivum TaxID=34406 RepID=A0AAX4J4D1_9PEZI|nr:Putative Sirtuin family, DHS-like NAD/FAD-binding domain superfamily [Colletotrichum destructivum]